MFPTELEEVRERDRARGFDARPDFAPPPLVKSGIDVVPPVAGRPVDAKALHAYRVAVVRAVEKAGDGEPKVDPKVVEAANRTPYQVHRDVAAARERVGLHRRIEQAQEELARLRDQGPPAAPPVVKIGAKATVDDLRAAEKENAKRAQEAWQQRESYNGSMTSCEIRTRLARQELAESCSPVLRRQLRDLHREFDRTRDRQMQLDVLAGEEAEIASVEKAIQRLRSGVLLRSEQVRSFRDRISDLLIPARKKTYDEAELKIQERRRVELLDQYQKRLERLKRRAPVHAKGRQQAAELQREAGRLADEIHRLQQEQLRPEQFPLTP